MMMFVGLTGIMELLVNKREEGQGGELGLGRPGTSLFPLSGSALSLAQFLQRCRG